MKIEIPDQDLWQRLEYLTEAFVMNAPLQIKETVDKLYLQLRDAVKNRGVPDEDMDAILDAMEEPYKEMLLKAMGCGFAVYYTNSEEQLKQAAEEKKP